jgi:NAD-dependent SIR2 family protein deacetylase
MATSSTADAALELALSRAAAAIADAEALIVFTGAGMGVDSGLGTYRGANAGVWRAGHDLGWSYEQLCRSQHLFAEQAPQTSLDSKPDTEPEPEQPPGANVIDARLAWAFWRFSYEMYTAGSKPHAGYALLKQWGDRTKHGMFAVTSNVDGHWLRTLGEDSRRVYEIHGSVQHMQIMKPSPTLAQLGVDAVWPVDSERDYESMTVDAAVDPARIQPTAPLPVHPKVEYVIQEARQCRPNLSDTEAEALATAMRARPNVLMFGDPDFDRTRADVQDGCYFDWKEQLTTQAAKVCVIEIGAGQAVRTIKDLAESELAEFPSAKFIRINYSKDDGVIPEKVHDYFNPRRGNEDEMTVVGDRGISIIGLGALDALQRIDSRLQVVCGEA